MKRCLRDFQWGGWSLWLMLLTINACTVGPTYTPPLIELPTEWKGSQDSNEIGNIDNWWEVFEDPILEDLEKRAVENNKKLEIALARICEVRALAGVEKSELYPHFDLNAKYGSLASLIKVFGIPNIPGSPPSPNIIRVHELVYSLTSFMRYDLDLWGRLRNQYKAGLLTVQAAEEGYCAAMLALTTDLAANYFQMRALDTQREIIEKMIATRKESVAVNKTRFEKKLANYTDVSRAEVLLYDAEAELSSVKRKRALKENKIALLIGIPASEFQIESYPLQGPPPEIPAGIPSEVLLRRPDIAEAERKAAAEHAKINAAYASLFPSISLTGMLGSSSPNMANILTWKSRLWGFGADLTEPIFDGWNRLSKINYSVAKFLEASADYQETVLEAFQDVENALVNISLQKEEMENIQKALDASIETTRLSRIRYLQGLTNYLDVAESERSELELKRVDADLLGWRYVSTVELIKAIGGGF